MKLGEWVPSIDVMAEDGELIVRVEAPGVDPESVDLTIEGELLTISGSRHFEDEVKEESYASKEIFEGSFRRVIRLPDGVDAEAITASSKDGILTVRIPKNPQVLPRQVKIEIEK
jgi:HSP20 family protein